MGDTERIHPDTAKKIRDDQERKRREREGGYARQQAKSGDNVAENLATQAALNQNVGGRALQPQSPNDAAGVRQPHSPNDAPAHDSAPSHGHASHDSGSGFSDSAGAGDGGGGSGGGGDGGGGGGSD